MKNLHSKKPSNGSNFGWLIQQMSINQKSGWQTFGKGLYQALFSFRLACQNVIYKGKADLRLGINSSSPKGVSIFNYQNKG